MYFIYLTICQQLIFPALFQDYPDTNVRTGQFSKKTNGPGIQLLIRIDMLKAHKFPEILEEKNNSNGSEPAQKSYHSLINYFLGILQQIRVQIIYDLDFKTGHKSGPM